jgi:ribosomal subunit interface protein
MQIPLEICYKNLDKSEALEARIREKVEKFERYADRITSCRVVVEGPNRHHVHGGCFAVRIDLHVPGEELIIKRDGKDPAHTDVYVAVRDAFDAAFRKLAQHSHRKLNGYGGAEAKLSSELSTELEV